MAKADIEIMVEYCGFRRESAGLFIEQLESLQRKYVPTTQAAICAGCCSECKALTSEVAAKAERVTRTSPEWHIPDDIG